MWDTGIQEEKNFVSKYLSIEGSFSFLWVNSMSNKKMLNIYFFFIAINVKHWLHWYFESGFITHSWCLCVLVCSIKNREKTLNNSTGHPATQGDKVTWSLCSMPKRRKEQTQLQRQWWPLKWLLNNNNFQVRRRYRKGYGKKQHLSFLEKISFGYCNRFLTRGTLREWNGGQGDRIQDWAFCYFIF